MLMEQSTAYSFSEGIRRAKKRYVTLAIMLPVILIAFMILNPLSKDLSPVVTITIGFISFVIIGLTFYFTASRAIRKLSELSVSILSDKLVRQGRKQTETFLWKEILNAKITEYPTGEVAAIKLSFANKKRLTLFGFEDMEAAIKQIEQNIPENVSIHRKRARVNWDNPVIMSLIMVLTFFIILAVLKIGKDAYQFFNVIFFSAFGIYTLTARPISRTQGKGWVKFETIIGITLIACSVLLFAVTLFDVLK